MSLSDFVPLPEDALQLVVAPLSHVVALRHCDSGKGRRSELSHCRTHLEVRQVRQRRPSGATQLPAKTPARGVSKNEA
jgi:hypothetical protein